MMAAEEVSDQEKCTKLSVQNAARSARFRLSQLKAGPSIAGSATRARNQGKAVL
jgi:hypothetical protein